MRAIQKYMSSPLLKCRSSLISPLISWSVCGKWMLSYYCPGFSNSQLPVMKNEKKVQMTRWVVKLVVETTNTGTVVRCAVYWLSLKLSRQRHGINDCEVCWIHLSSLRGRPGTLCGKPTFDRHVLWTGGRAQCRQVGSSCSKWRTSSIAGSYSPVRTELSCNSKVSIYS